MLHCLRGRPALLCAAAVAAGALATAALAAPGADAAFTSGKCQGAAAFEGAGATFQAGAHNNVWKTTAFAEYCGAGVTPPQMTYNAGGSGSGYGRRVMGARTGDNADGSKSRSRVERFGASDEPPTQTDIDNINRGTDAIGDEGVIRTIPVSIGAAAILVNLPDGCDGFYLAGNPNVSDRGDANRQRIELTDEQVEKAFAGEATWGDLVPSITGAGCAALPVKRVVRRDDSGTTYVVKDYLDAINAGGEWLTTYITPNTTNWPAGNAAVVPGDVDGGSGQVDKADLTDGSIAYAELGTARRNDIFERGVGVDDKYWVKVGPGTGPDAFVDPNVDPDGFLTTTGAADKGAACVGVPVSGVPGGADPSVQLWTDATAVNPSTAGIYDICSLTYALAFDDNAAAYGNTPAEEASARSVYDYLQAVLSNIGQSPTSTGLAGVADQAPLPPDLLTISRNAVNAIGWNKTPSGGGTPPPGGGGTPPGGGGTPPPPGKPSNAFTISSARTAGSKNDLKFTIQVPGAGSVVASASGKPKKGKRVSLGRVTARATAGGPVRLTLKMSSKARKALNKAKRLSVKISITYTPTGGDPKTLSRTITVKAKQATKKK